MLHYLYWRDFMIILSVFVMLLLLFLSGIVAQRLLGIAFSFTNAILLGFLSLLALFHIIAYPMMQLEASFTLLFWSYSTLLAGISLGGIYLLCRTQRSCRRIPIQGTLQASFKALPLTAVAAYIMAVFLITSCCFAYVESDNSYYLPRAAEIIAQDNVGVSYGLIWSGISQVSCPAQADASTLEAWRAYWSHLFGIHPTVFSLNTLTIVVQLVSWCALIQAYCALSGHKEDWTVLMVFTIFYYLFIFSRNGQAGTIQTWTLRYPAEGKAILLSVIHPALIYSCARIVNCNKEKIHWTKWLMVSITLTAGIAVTVIGVFWPILCCITMGLPYLLIERRKDFWKLIPPLVVTCLPVILYAGITLLFIVNEAGHYFEFQVPSWINTISSSINLRLMPVFVLSLLYILFKGGKTAKYILAGGTITLFATFANPLLVEPVSRYITTGEVYFRIFWMVPICFVPAYCAAELYRKCARPVQRLFGISLAVILAVFLAVGVHQHGMRQIYFGMDSIFQLSTGNEFRANAYGLTQIEFEQACTLLEGAEEDERVRAMWLSEEDCLLRQTSERLEMLGACRPYHWEYYTIPLETADVSPLDLRENFIQEGRNDFSDPLWASRQLAASGVDFICVDNTSGFANRDTVPEGFEFYAEVDTLTIFRVLQP